MTFSKEMAAYADIQKVLEQALEAPRGIEVTLSSSSEMTHWLSRLNYFRKLDREENKKTYPEGNRLYGKSLYDSLRYKRPRDSATVQILKIADNPVEIKEL